MSLYHYLSPNCSIVQSTIPEETSNLQICDFSISIFKNIAPISVSISNKRFTLFFSRLIGSIIAATCGANLKPVVLELGGKAPLIVMADANLAHAANAILFGGFYHSGQICMATQTAICHESIVEPLLELLKSQSANVKASGVTSDGAALRGLFTNASADRTNEIVQDALSKGATVGLGEVSKKDENVVQPLMLVGVTSAMRIYKEEMFSPVFSLVTFKTEEEAIAIANDHDCMYSSSSFDISSFT